jgi:hypothetical protein
VSHSCDAEGRLQLGFPSQTGGTSRKSLRGSTAEAKLVGLLLNVIRRRSTRATVEQSPVTADNQRRNWRISLLDTRTLLDLADKSHLLLLVLLIFFLGFLDVVAMTAKCGFRCLSEVVNYYYEFRAQWVNSKARFQQASMKGHDALRHSSQVDA